MPIEILVFNGNQRIAEDGSKIIVARHNPALQRERPNYAPWSSYNSVIELGRYASSASTCGRSVV